MRIIIAGSRNIPGSGITQLNNMIYRHFQGNVPEEYSWSEIIEAVASGKAEGGDTIGERWAESKGVPIEPFYADWSNISLPGAVVKRNRSGAKYNALAGYNRNERMAAWASEKPGGILFLLRNSGKSNGTDHMARMGAKYGLQIRTHIFKEIG